MNTQHTGTWTPRPIGRNRRKRIAAVALLTVGLATGTAHADEPVEHVAPPPSLYRVALPVVTR